ncbi:MAG: hypothetical protein AAGE61_00890 [Pseudomonadota bacterium]
MDLDQTLNQIDALSAQNKARSNRTVIGGYDLDAVLSNIDASNSKPFMMHGVEVPPESAAAIKHRADQLEASQFRGGPLGTFQDATRGAERGFLARFNDEIAAAIGTPVQAFRTGQGFTETYKQELAAQRELDHRAEQRSPIATMAGEVSGLGGITQAPKAAAGAVNAAQQAPTFLERMWSGAKAGGLYGGAVSAGDSEGDLSQNFQDTAQGTVLGAATGAAAAPVLSAASAGASALRSAGSTFMNLAGKPAKSVPQNLIQQAVREGGDSIDDLIARLDGLQNSSLGDEARFIDALGDAGGRLGRAVADRGGKGAQKLVETTVDRQAGQIDRIGREVSNLLGDPSTYFGTLDDVTARLKTVAAPYYERAFAKTLPKSDTLKAISKRIPEQAEAIARKLAKANGIDFEDLPELQAFDLVKEGLDDLIEREVGKGAGGGLTRLGRAYDNLRRDLLAELDLLIPEYAQARRVFSDELSLKSALEKGRKALTADFEITKKAFGEFSDAEKQMFRIGIARDLQKRLGNIGSLTADSTRSIWNGNKRDVLRVVFDSEEDFARFANSMNAERTANQTFNQINTGSKTNRNAISSGNIAAGEIIDTAIDVGRGQYTNPIVRAGQTIGNRARGINDQNADMLAGILMGKKVPEFLSRAPATDPALRTELSRYLARQLGAGVNR